MSSEYLVNLLKQYNPNIKVFSNYIDKWPKLKCNKDITIFFNIINRFNKFKKYSYIKFNKGKSNLKFIETTYNCVVLVSLIVYSNIVQEGYTGLIYHNNENF